MTNIEVTIAVEDWMLLNAFMDWAERNSIKCTKIYRDLDWKDGKRNHDLCFKIDKEDFDTFLYEYFITKVDV